jgi:hypothetical protein
MLYNYMFLLIIIPESTPPQPAGVWARKSPHGDGLLSCAGRSAGAALPSQVGMNTATGRERLAGVTG